MDLGLFIMRVTFRAGHGCARQQATNRKRSMIARTLSEETQEAGRNDI